MDEFTCQFELCARSFSNNIAVLYCDNSCIINKFIYKDLLDISEDISAVLQKHVQQNTCIAITTKPNPYLPAFIFSIHKQKCAFLCINIKLSELNILHLINQVKLKWILNYDSTDCVNSLLNQNATLVCNIQLANDRCGAELWKINNEEQLYKDVSYIIQTSGTTGRNKIVQVRHKCIMSNVNSLRRIFKITDKDIIYLGTPLTFDPFVIELFLALTAGACLLIVPDHIKLSNKLLLQTILPENKQLHSGVTFIQMPPSVFLCFSEEDIVNMLCKVSSLRILALGGEKFPGQLCKYKRCKQLQFFNLYGITEVSCWASVEEVTAVPVSLGETLDDTMFEIRTSDGNVIQNGEGQLFIGSRNRVCVINDECNYEYDSVIYRETGDIVRKDPMSQKIYYIGRTNSIIKRFGQRVCLSEIEQQVFDTTDLHAICVWDEHEMKLFLFIILKSYDAIVKNKIVDRLRIKLLHSLPEAANPDVIEILPSIPLTSNGKVDKKCLLNVIYVNKETNIEISPVNVFESIWSKYFGMSQCEIELRRECSFSEMGGNSILAIQLITDFDSRVSNSFSSDLMALFFDRNKCYKDYCSLIERNYKINSTVSTKRSIHIDNCASKSMKVSDKCNIPTMLLNIVWKYELGACVDATPIHIKHQRFGDLIAVGCHAHVFVILNAISGAVVSKTTLSSAVEGSACSSGCNERIIVGCYDGYVYCLNISDATVVWKYKTASSVKCTPILSSNNENIIFGSYDKALYCLKVKDGSLVWKVIIDESIKSNPILHDQKCYIATIQGTCLSVCENTGKCLWRSKTNTAIFGSPCVLNHENIILWPDVKGHIQCHSCINGDKLWTYQSAGFIYSSLCFVGNRVIFGCFDHHIYILQCHVDGCREIFKLNIGGQISSTPCVFSSADDKEYLIGVSNAGKLHMFSLDTALLLQTIDLPAEVFSSAVIVRNMVYVGCRDNHVYCIEINT